MQFYTLFSLFLACSLHLESAGSHPLWERSFPTAHRSLNILEPGDQPQWKHGSGKSDDQFDPEQMSEKPFYPVLLKRPYYG
ncbi:hypothetical protein D915_003644 [Fasciola hepatica]|uniref:Uncharacterized protein n=1 Tax=Fasciola hepatica TaxID=6192 RepID=A0A4E0RFF3_FASHE|nr:hypothetical protein D915_003644 [Fasciola hepatica]